MRQFLKPARDAAFVLQALLLICEVTPWEAHAQTPESILNRSVDSMGLRGRTGYLQVSYQGHWGLLVNGLQPALVDASFRRASTERIDLVHPRIAQLFKGPGGTKEVVRNGSGILVRFNGIESTDKEKREAAAIVADAYRMFVTGPIFVQEHAKDLRLSGHRSIGGKDCVVISGTLRPGLGFAPQDDLSIFVDQQTGYIRRYRFSVNGLASTQGVVVDVTCEEFQKEGPVVLPRHFVEWIRQPFTLLAHRWKVIGLDVSGLGPEKLNAQL